MKTIRWMAVVATLAMVSSFAAGRAAAQSGGSAAGSDDELKMMALNSLRGADAAVAVPQIEKLLAGNASIEVKKRALSVLAQTGAPGVEALGRVARSNANPVLQAEAIRQLGVSGGSDARKTLTDIYGSTSDAGNKKMILRSFMVARDKDRLVGAAKSEKDADLRSEAVRQLSAMSETNALVELYKTETSPDVKSQIIRGLHNVEAVDTLAQIAQTDSSPEMRTRAVRELGMIRGDRSAAALTGMYSKEKDAAVRKEILRALFIQENAKALIAVARTETDPELRSYAVRQLSVMRSKDAEDFMMEILTK